MGRRCLSFRLYRRRAAEPHGNPGTALLPTCRPRPPHGYGGTHPAAGHGEGGGVEAGELSGSDAAALVGRLRGHLDSVGGLTVPAERELARELVRRARRAD